MADPTIEVVIPTFNNADQLAECMQHLVRQTLNDFGVVVCVDGSRDRTRSFLAQSAWSFPMTVLEHADGLNHGRARTRNLALGVLTAPYVCLVDSDMCLDREALGQHMALLQRTRCASVGSIQYANAEASLWARYLATRGTNRYCDRSLLPFNQFVTANVALHTRDLVRLGGFDEAFTSYGGEDTDLGYRLSRDGVAILYNRRAKATTVEDKTLDGALRQFRSYGATNLRQLHAKHPEMPHVFGTQVVASSRWRDRATLALLNPNVARSVRHLIDFVPFALAKHLIRYEIASAVVAGYTDGGASR